MNAKLKKTAENWIQAHEEVLKFAGEFSVAEQKYMVAKNNLQKSFEEMQQATGPLTSSYLEIDGNIIQLIRSNGTELSQIIFVEPEVL